MLQRVAQRLQMLAPDDAMCARWGGEEFTVLLPNCSLQNAFETATMLQLDIEKHDFSDIAPSLRITISIGVASAKNASDYDRLLSHADQALYQAKQTGRNKVESEQP